MNRIGKKNAYSKLLKNVDTLLNIKTFHENDLEDSVAVARSYALLLYGKKGSDMDTLDELRYIMATTTDKSASMLLPTEDAFKQHVLRAKYQTRIWCNSHMPNEEVIEPVGHGWSACDDGGITQTMFTHASAPVNNNNHFLSANILEDRAQWRGKTKGLSILVIENNGWTRKLGG